MCIRDSLLGPWGKGIASFCILMLFYALASAYILSLIHISPELAIKWGWG